MVVIGNLDKRYLWIVIATAIPILIYILFPGKIGIGKLIESFIILLVCINLNKERVLIPLSTYPIVKIWLLILIIGLAHSFFVLPLNSENIRDIVVSALSSIPILFTICTINNINSIRDYQKSFWYIYVPLAVFSHYFWFGYLTSDASHILLPFCFLVVMTPYLNIKSLIILIVLLCVAILQDVSVRSCVISFCFSLLIILVYKCFNSFFLFWGKLTRHICFLLPLVFCFLGYIGSMNIFEEMQSLEFTSDAGIKKNRTNVMLDTRTPVYVDVVNAFEQSPEDLFLGKGSVTRIKTTAFRSYTDEAHIGRRAVEAGILNILLYYGIVGLLAFFILMYYSSYLGISKSNNTLCVIAAIYIAYKFFYMFVEDADINITTYLAIGICLNPYIRELSDSDVFALINKNNNE